ncbi:MAG: aminotransferase class V-fold PLP-dependent enzyme [Desulfatiglandales bacterium]
MNSKKFLEDFREDFPSLKRRHNGNPPIYLDNACTTLVPSQVISSIMEYYRKYPSCSGKRSRHWFADEVASRIEGNSDKGMKGSRQIIAEFINAKSDQEIAFTLNTTHAINIVALGFKFQLGDIILLTDKEHNSNLVPWLRLQQKGLVTVDYATQNHEDFDLKGFEEKLKNQAVRFVSMAYTSNITGYTIPAKEIIEIAHKYGARVLLDGAQMVPHKTVDVQDLDVDFLAFSMHKMCGPRGVGVLYGKKELMGWNQSGEKGTIGDEVEPAILGGGTVGDTTYHSYSLLEMPDRFEAGTHNYPGQIASGAAIQYLQRIGMDRINEHETILNRFLTEESLSRYGSTEWFRILGPRDVKKRGGILTFEVRRPNAVRIAEELSKKNNIMIRDGAFCAHSYFNNEFGEGWTRSASHSDHRMVYRVSFYLYNTIEECRIFLETLDDIFKERSYI